MKYEASNFSVNNDTGRCRNQLLFDFINQIFTSFVEADVRDMKLSGRLAGKKIALKLKSGNDFIDVFSHNRQKKGNVCYVIYFSWNNKPQLGKTWIFIICHLYLGYRKVFGLTNFSELSGGLRFRLQGRGKLYWSIWT